jgi:cell division protein FtsI (penicillin-binding protein 3)
MIYKGSQIVIHRKKSKLRSFSIPKGSYPAQNLTTRSVPARKLRLVAFFTLCCIWSSCLVWRLYSLQISNYSTWQDWALKQHFQDVQLASERGPIYDRDGNLLAVSVPAGSIYLRPKQVRDKTETIKELSDILKIKPAVIEKKLNETQPFVWLERQLPRATAEKAQNLKLPGVGYVVESRRFYPYNHAAGTLIGKVGIDGNGLSGLEAVFEKNLHKDQQKTKMVRDAFGNMIDVSSKPEEKFNLPKGSELRLTLNADLQLITDEELEKGRQAANAKNAMAVMIDADSGEILALSQAPSTNLNTNNINPQKDLKNLIIETVFEPGSIFKPLVAAAAIEEGLASPNDLINCEKGHFFYASHMINDVHPNDVIRLSDVIIRSSNIGITKIGLRLGEKKLYSYLEQLGFTEKALNLLPGETRGILRPLDKWAKIDVATHSYGQGVAVTPLQILRAISSIANGGILPSLHVVADNKKPEGKRVFSPETAAKVKEMMYSVVTDEHGTGHFAEIPGVKVGGKTGTAQKARKDGKGYMPGAYMSSFVGFADASAINIKKNLALIVVIDEPSAKSIYGGVLAAPVFKKIIQRSLHYFTAKAGLPDLTELKKEKEEKEEKEQEDVILEPVHPEVMKISYDS